jgi:dTDP-4-dehydrorhamnose reductase
MKSRMKILILGAGGQLGTLIVAGAPAHAQVYAANSAEINICDAEQLNMKIANIAPDVIINAAAYTQVDKAEAESAQAWAVNHQGVRNIIEASGASTRIIHISTDFVFDGIATMPYLPDAKANPVSVYGHSKQAGEQELQKNAPERSCIIRTAWLYAAEGKNFMNTMLNLLATKEQLSVVDDQKGTPTSAHKLAEVIWRFVERPQLHGIFHWTDQGEATWYTFANEIQRLGLEYGVLQKKIPVRPIPTSAYPTPARRPAYSVLDKHSTWSAIGIESSPWQQELGKVLKIKATLQDKSKQ